MALQQAARRSARMSSGTLLLAESMCRMGVGFLVATVLARGYGPDGLGLITTASSLVTIALGFSALGLSGVLIRELVNRPHARGTLLLTVTLGKAVAGLILLSVLMIGLYQFSRTPGLAPLVLIMGVGSLFTALDTVDALYNARREFPRLVALRLSSLAGSTALKLAAIQWDWGLKFVALGYALDYATVYLLPAVDLAIRRSGGLRDGTIELASEPAELLALVRQSWPVLISGGFAQINLKIDSVMIAAMASVTSVGTYSAAARLSEAWTVLAMAIVTAAFPGLVEVSRGAIANYARALSVLLRRLIWLSVAGAVVVALSAGPIISLVYGDGFADSASVLSIHVVGGVFLFVRTAVSRWLIVENLLGFSLVSHASGAVVNIVLNCALIPAYGIRGAALASVASYAVSGLLFLLFTRRTRPMFYIILLAALPQRLAEDRIRAHTAVLAAHRRVTHAT